MMRRILIALTALMLLGGVAGVARAQSDSAAVSSASQKDTPANGGNCGDNMDNDGDELIDAADPGCDQPGCEPSGVQPKKCQEDSDNQPDPCADRGGDTDGDGICDDDEDACADLGGDTDGDGVCDNDDNCADVANPDQADSDDNGVGDACEPDACADNGGDTDGDGVCGNTDNCPNTANPGQADTDGDGKGDACDPGNPPVNKCTAGTHDPGILTDDTLGQTLWDGGLQLPPLTEDPEADGPISGAIYGFGNGSPLEPVTDEASCLVDLLLDGPALGIDL
jgi:hypothetical protein